MLDFDKEVLLDLNSWISCFETMKVDVVETCLNACRLIWNNKNQCFHHQMCRLPSRLELVATKIQEHFQVIFSSSRSGI